MTHDDSRRPTTDLTPSDIASASFRYVRRGYDIEEVDQFLAEVAQVVDRALSQATAMEARARAAVARLNDHSGSADKAVGEANAETITRTLLMAQRAADAAVEEARVDAERVRKEADLESERVRAAAAFEAQQLVATATARADELVETARANARQADEDERRRAVDEVASLLARREALVADVDQVEKFLVEQRERLRGAARQLEILCERIPGGLGAVPPPVLADSGEVVADASSIDLPDAADTPDVIAPPDAADVSDAADVPDPVDVPAVPVDVDDAADDHATTSAPAANEP
ncbi:MAG: DivIVA domain-containing protein, partial [Ilumatobacteraceae bacterium]